MFPEYTSRERAADGVIHVLTVAAVLGATIAMMAVAATDAGTGRIVALAVYGVGLLAMAGFSAGYNLTSHLRWKEILRRLDHAAIFVMIAGTCTPLTAIVIGGTFGYALLAAVWGIAVIGIAVKLLWPRRFERLSIVACLLQGWVVLAAIGPLMAALSAPALGLLLAGAGIYSLGVAFHLCRGLRYQNAIWHLCVLVAAGCHYVAVLDAVLPSAVAI